MIITAQTIRAFKIIKPYHERTVHEGYTFGQGPASYDVRIAQDIFLQPGEFKLGSTIEHFDMPHIIAGQVFDKSTWARQGLSLFNTYIDPGWMGYLTLELKNMGNDVLYIKAGTPIAQVVFQKLDAFTDRPYHGKYMYQESVPVGPIFEEVKR
jgi:dCTP deaminase